MSSLYVALYVFCLFEAPEYFTSGGMVRTHSREFAENLEIFA
jgi:hypothetical protein